MPSKKKRKESNESKLVYVPFIILAIFAIVFITLPMIYSSNANTSPSFNSPSTKLETNTPFFQFAKVSNENYAGNNTVEVYFISWYGCPNGASDSWGLYIALSHYGMLNVTPNYSDLETVHTPTNDVLGEVPGLIFNTFEQKSNVSFHLSFHPIYLLGRIFTSNSTATLPNGTLITYSGNSLVNIELNELKNSAPSWVYNLIVKYQIQTPFTNSKGIAYSGNPPHIVSTIIITGPNGTWMMLGYDQQIKYGSPGLLAQYAAQFNYNASVPYQLLKDIQAGIIPTNPVDLSFIKQEGLQIMQIIKEAAE